MNVEQIEDIHPLAPMQQGMLFHSLYAPRSGMYVSQSCYILGGDLNIPAFQRAWQTVIERHQVLRSSFHWEELDEPLQVVHQSAELPFHSRDWRALPGADQDERLEAFLREDRARGFELDQAPLLRLTLIRTAEQRYYFVWSNHHLLLDGWSQAIVMKEVLACYQACCRGEPARLAPSRPYGDYIVWLQAQDLAAAEAFWRHYLRGFAAPTALRVTRSHGAGDEREDSYG